MADNLVYGFPDHEWLHCTMMKMTEYHSVFLDFELHEVTKWHFGVMSQRDRVSMRKIRCPWMSALWQEQLFVPYLLPPSFKF